MRKRACRAVIASCAWLLASTEACAPLHGDQPPPTVPDVVEQAAPREVQKDDELEELLRSDEELAGFVGDAARRRLQVVVTIPGEGTGLRRFGHRVDAEYFYPASAVKLAAAFGVLDKLEDLRSSPGSARLGLGTKVRFVEGTGKTRRVLTTTLEAELEKSLVLSDNEAHNRLFDFVGPWELASRLTRAGLLSARIAQRLGRADPDDALPPLIEMRPANNRSPIAIAQRTDFEIPPAPAELLVGTSHVDANGSVVAGPMDFSKKNIISLRDLHYLLIAVTRPDLADRGKPLLRNEEDRKRLVAILGMLPSELPAKTRRLAQRPDGAYKPMQAAIAGALPRDRVRVYEKGGRAYGFSVESAYAENASTGRSFFVTATIYANDNETLNDDRYDYETIASPFMTRLGQVLARRFLSSPAASN